MRKPRVFVDFQNADPRGRLRLGCQGTLHDLDRQQIELRRGLALTLYEDDADERGQPQQLVVDGVVEYSDEEQTWVAMIDWDAIQYLPQTTNGPPLVNAARKQTAE
jgi:hypothetical protein